jgi:hypothetical protein
VKSKTILFVAYLILKGFLKLILLDRSFSFKQIAEFFINKMKAFFSLLGPHVKWKNLIHFDRCYAIKVPVYLLEDIHLGLGRVLIGD